jgi:hypothetical protein
MSHARVGNIPSLAGKDGGTASHNAGLLRKKPRQTGFIGSCEAVASDGLIAYMLRMKRFWLAPAWSRHFGYE